MEFIHARDNYMLTQIPLKMRELLDKRPELKKKPEIKVLISLGAMHSPLYIGLKSLTMDAKRINKSMDAKKKLTKDKSGTPSIAGPFST